METNNSSAVVVAIDFINEIVAPEGKLAGKGYADFVERHQTLEKVAQLMEKARAAGVPVVHVRIGFSPSYAEHPAESPLFGGAKRFGALTIGGWGTEFHPKAAPIDGETVIIKHRVSAFFGTPLDLLLKTNRVRKVLLCGVATDLAVQSAARDAHDRDYVVTVVADCCAAANDDDHDNSITVLKKIGSVQTLAEVELPQVMPTTL